MNHQDLQDLIDAHTQVVLGEKAMAKKLQELVKAVNEAQKEMNKSEEKTNA